MMNPNRWDAMDMATTVNIHEAKTHLSRLLESVERGEEVVIARAGHPVAKLSQFSPARPRVADPGSMQGTDWWSADDFDAPIDELFERPPGVAGER
jgi:antitoxin (DNA-binding transcriptional repressor) of toxin-antitoxin stability system